MLSIQHYTDARRRTIRTHVMNRPIFELYCQLKRPPRSPTGTLVLWERQQVEICRRSAHLATV